MNRRTAQDSDDSDSDWDTTVAESPTHQEPPKLSTAASGAHFQETTEGGYATVLPKPRSSLQGNVNGKSDPAPSKQDPSQSKGASSMTSPPPHMGTFQNALTDYNPTYEPAPDLPARGYEGKGKLYTVPESDSFMSPQANIANWNDSDAEERVLKELQQNLERDKQRQQQQQAAANRDRKVTMAAGDKVTGAADNHGYMPSPGATRSTESTLEKWTRANESKQGKAPAHDKGHDTTAGGKQKSVIITDISDPSIFKPPSQYRMATSYTEDSERPGKKFVFHFEEGSPHFVEVHEDDVDSLLPEKADDFEKLISRTWKEVFAVVRMITSIFVIFVVELVNFVVHHIARPLLLDTVSAVGNFIIKPLLTVLFNAIIQPVFAFLWNTFSAVSRSLDPVYRLLGSVLSPVAGLLRAFRLVTVNTSSREYRHELDVV